MTGLGGRESRQDELSGKIGSESCFQDYLDCVVVGECSQVFLFVNTRRVLHGSSNGTFFFQRKITENSLGKFHLLFHPLSFLLIQVNTNFVIVFPVTMNILKSQRFAF